MKLKFQWVRSLMLGLTAVAMLMACSRQEDNYLTSLDPDASMVIKMNLATLAEKSGQLNNPMVTAMLAQLQAGVPADMKDQVAAIVKDPAESGVDLTKPMVLTCNIANRTSTMLFALTDASKLEALLTRCEENGLDVKLTTASDDLKIVTAGQEMVAVFNSTRLLIGVETRNFASLDVKISYLEKLARQSLAESLLAKENFKAFAESDRDLAFYMDYETLMAQAAGLTLDDVTATIDAQSEMYKNSAVFADINFEKGQVVGSSNFYLNDSLAALVAGCHQKPSGRFLGLVANNSFMVANCAVTNLSGAMAWLTPETRDFYDQTLLQTFGMGAEIFNSLDGDLLFALSSVAATAEVPVPAITMVAQCKDRVLFDAIVARLNEADRGRGDFKKVTDDVYVLALRSAIGYDLSLAYADNAIVVMPDALLQEHLVDGKLRDGSSSMADSKFAAPLKKGGLIIDFQAAASDPGIVQFLSSEPSYVPALTALQQLESWILYSKNLTSTEGVLTLADKDQNALAGLIAIGMMVTMQYNN